jgi:tetratricopeptide (TPR) repeat protein
MKEVWDNTMGRANLTFDSKSFVWPIYEAIRAQGIADEEINKGYRAYNYQYERIEIDGKKLWKGKNELYDVGGDLTDLEVLEYAFDNYQKYRDVIKKTTGHYAPWDWQGQMHAHLVSKIGEIIASTESDPWTAVDTLFDYFHHDSNGGIDFYRFGRCEKESSALEAYGAQCGNGSEGTWIFGGMLAVLQEHIPMRIDFLRVAFNPERPLPAMLNHMAVAVTIDGKTKIDDPAHGDINIGSLYERTRSHSVYITPRQAFAHFFSLRAKDMAFEGDARRALSVAAMAERIDPANPDAKAAKGYAMNRFYGNNKIAESYSAFREAWKLNKQNTEYCLALGRAALQAECKSCLKVAEIALSRVINLNKSIAEAYFLLGVTRLRQNNLNQARKCFIVTLKKNPAHKEAIIYLDRVKRLISTR